MPYGNDRLTGGICCADVFVFVGYHGVDRITDFNATGGGDRIELRGAVRMDNFQQIRAAAYADGQNVVIETSSTSRIILENVQLSDLDASDFIF